MGQRGTGSGRRGPHRTGRRVVLAVVALGSLWLVVTGDGDLLVGLLLWSLVAVPLVLFGIFSARHDGDIGRFLGGRDPYEGHGPD